ncbi:uncharacterized protein ACNS7B_003996 [Menidia menidia]
MDLILLLTLSLCCHAAAGRYVWSDKPKLIVDSHEIEDGESLNVSCTLPVDYLGGSCRLFRGQNKVAFRSMTATSYVCDFWLSSGELLGTHEVGSTVSIYCDYTLQEFVSKSSDRSSVTVWGTGPSPTLSISRCIISRRESIEVTCTPPVDFVDKCHFYKNGYSFKWGSCRRNLTGEEIAIWERPSPLLSFNLTCTYDPDMHRSIRSRHSNRQQLSVADQSKAAPSADCEVSGNHH